MRAHPIIFVFVFILYIIYVWLNWGIRIYDLLSVFYFTHIMFIINQISPHDAYDTLDAWNAGSEGSCYRGLSFRQGNPRMCCLQGLHTNKPTHQSLKGRLVKGVSMFCRQWSIKWPWLNWIRLCHSVSILTSQSLAPSPHMPTLYLAMIQKTALKISLDSHKQINTSHI